MGAWNHHSLGDIMDTHWIKSPAIGQRVRAIDSFGEVVGGGEVLAVDHLYVTVEQRYVYRHNGVVVERGAQPMRYSHAGYRFESLDEPWSGMEW